MLRVEWQHPQRSLAGAPPAGSAGLPMLDPERSNLVGKAPLPRSETILNKITLPPQFYSAGFQVGVKSRRIRLRSY
jgi:hypothetical protein